MTLWVPPSCRPQPAQISQKERVCVLVHIDTGRILCFARDDAFASSFEQRGYIKHEIFHAHEYDLWARKLREQTRVENAAEDAAYLEREDRVRQSLRKELRQKMMNAPSGAARKAIESALHCLDHMEDKKKRYRAESFMVQEAYDEKKNVGEELVHELIDPKNNAK